MSSQATTHFSFLKLPAELRNKIYRLVLVSEDKSKLLVSKDNTSARTALLKTCSVIRAESSGIFYGENTFDLPVEVGEKKRKSSFGWLKAMEQNVTLIRSLIVSIEPTEDGWCLDNRETEAYAKAITDALAEAQSAGLKIGAVEGVEYGRREPGENSSTQVPFLNKLVTRWVNLHALKEAMRKRSTMRSA